MMDTATFDVHSMRLREFIEDEDKIVTYKWLSSELEVHVNYAKELLLQYVKDSNNKADLTITYLIGGKLKDSNEISVQLVRDGEKRNAEKRFESILFHHVYSIQKETDCSSLYYLHNVDKNLQHKYIGTIDFNKDIMKDPSLKPKPLLEVNPELPKLGNSNAKPIKKNGTQSLSQMFQDQSKKNDQKDNKKESPKQEDKPKKPPPKPQGKGIAGFFQKSPKGQPSTSTTVEKKDQSPKDLAKTAKPKISPEKTVNKTVNKLIDTDDEEDDIVVKTPEVKKSSKDSKKRGRKTKEKNEFPPSKKHKRILDVCDDGSSEEEQIFDRSTLISDEEEEVIPPTPQPTVNVKRIKKQVTETYRDEEGFLVTRKVDVIETEEEAEQVDSKPKPPIDVSNKKPASKPKEEPKNNKTGKAGKKQATLASFFKPK